MIQVTVAVEIERVDVCVFMLPSKRPAVPVTSGELGRGRAVPGCDADDRTMQQLGSWQGPGHRRQGMIIPAGIGEGKEHGLDPLLG